MLSYFRPMLFYWTIYSLPGTPLTLLSLMIGREKLPVLGHAYSAFRQCEALVNAQLQRFQVVQGVFFTEDLSIYRRLGP